MYDDLRPELSIYGKKHMKTPNFQRLAAKSVVFEKAYAQVAVCNPSRASLLTGLRPDIVRVVDFKADFRPHITIPTHLISEGYKTAGVGKIFHWESNEKHIWSEEQVGGEEWYTYQGFEYTYMNASTTPDNIHDVKWFKDYNYTTEAIRLLNQLSSNSNKNENKETTISKSKSNQEKDKFFLGVGFKLPHLQLHVPKKYWDMYSGSDMKAAWKLPRRGLTFPFNSPSISYRCCAESRFYYLQDNGSTFSHHHSNLGNIQNSIPMKMRDELMQSYSAAVTFLDDQLGRFLDAIDELEMWDDVSIILTADHGMHNGERGIWEKWTLFDESTHVPLIIYDPRVIAPKRVKQPVELIDVYPTILDLVGSNVSNSNKPCMQFGEYICKERQGRSLLPLMISENEEEEVPPEHTGAISQMLRCIDRSSYEEAKVKLKDNGRSLSVFESSMYRLEWLGDCPRIKGGRIDSIKYFPVMGYSYRTKLMRYVAWYEFDQKHWRPIMYPMIFEELYDHSHHAIDTSRKFHTKANSSHSGFNSSMILYSNLAHNSRYKQILNKNRQELIQMLHNMHSV